MTSAQPITRQLQPYLQQGLELWLEGDMLRFKAPGNLMTPALRALLKQNKEAIVAWLNSEGTSSARVVDEFPLASTQSAIWMLYRFAPDSPAYNTSFACQIKGALDEMAVRQALHALMLRHPMLRTTFHDTDEGPRQRVWDYLEMPLQVVDGRHWTADEVDQWLNQEADAPFDLTTQSCLRVKIVRDSVRGNLLIATVHHIGADLWALLLIASDIRELYQRAAQGEVLAMQSVNVHYRQHVEWQQAFLQSEQGRQMRRYWQHTLQGAPLNVTLPTDSDRPPLLQLKTAVLQQKLDQNLTRNIRSFCKQHGVTPFVLLQSALQLLIHHYTGAEDFLVGTPTLGRSRSGMDQVVGDFANPVVLRAWIEPSQSVQALLGQVRQSVLRAMEHQEYPFPAVVQDCNPPRDSSRTPLFQIMFVWHQGNINLLAQDDWIGEVLPQTGPRGAPYDVMLAVSDLGERLELNWTYQTSLYRAASIEQFGSAFLTIIGRMLEPDLIRVGDCLPARPHPQFLHAGEVALTVEDRQRLQPYVHCVLQQTLPDGRVCRRLFVEASPETDAPALRQWLQDGFPGVDDVTLLSRLPRTGEGMLNMAALLATPLVDRQRILQDLKQQKRLPGDVAVLHQRQIVPSVDASEIHHWQQQVKTPLYPRSVNLAQRPDAWVVGQPISLPEDMPKHLFAALELTARHHPDRGIILYDEQRNHSHLSYATLVHDARRVAAALLNSGLEKGSILLLQMRYDQRFFAVWWGALLYGLKPLNVAVPPYYSERNGVAQKLYNVAHNYVGLSVVADADILEQTRQWLGASITVLDGDALLQETRLYDGQPGHDAVAFLQLTSGSTGIPKAIQITHHGVLHQILASARHNGYHADDITLNWLPFDHVVPILTTHIKDCVLGIRQIQLPTQSVLNDPLWWLQAMSDHQVSHSWAPNFAFQRVVDALRACPEMPELDLSAVRLLMNAGEQVLAPVVEQFYSLCSPFGLRDSSIQPAFGMAEACTCITYNNNSSDLLSIHFNPATEACVCDIGNAAACRYGFVDLGTLIPGVEIRIADENNQLVKEGVIGRLQIRGPVVTPGYLNNPAANAEAFVGDGWFNSGDLGFIWQQRLILTGREKEMIVVNGANYYCFELEQAATIPGVRPTFVAATGVALEAGANSDELVLFYVPDGTVEQGLLERQMSAQVAEAFGVTPVYLIAVEADQFHKTTSGKIQRNQFRKQFEQQHYVDQVNAYRKRHQHDRDLCTTLFRLGFHSEQMRHMPDGRLMLGVIPSLADHPSVERWRRAGAMIQVMGDAPSGQPSSLLLVGDLTAADQDISELLRAIAVRLTLLHQQGWPLETATIAVLGVSAADTLLLKPLIETLRQEKGLPQLQGCVLSADLESLPCTASLAGTGIVGWIDGDLAQRPLLRPVNLTTAADTGIVDRGIYAITGAFAALAEPLCQYLIERKRCRVILLGRTPLDPSSPRQRQFRRWQQRWGADQLDYQELADWTLEQLRLAVSSGLEKFAAPHLHGVFHLAGCLEMAALDEVDDSHWHKQVHPKWRGASVLADYLARYAPGSVLIHYSSVNAFLGGQHAAAYSVANALQSWQTLKRESDVRIWCLHWSVWTGAGMAAHFITAQLQAARNKGLLPLEKSRDLFWLDQVLKQPPGNYYIGIDAAAQSLVHDLDFNTRYRDHFHVHLHWAQATASPDARKWLIEPLPAIDRVQIHEHHWRQPLPQLAGGQIDFASLQNATLVAEEQVIPPADPNERDLQQIWSEVLKRPINDVTRSFFEYGGHSINASQLMARINHRFQLNLTVAHLFQYPSIRQLAALLAHGSQDPSGSLPLGLHDFIARASGFRLDCVNPSSSADRDIVFLPTALGLASAYLPLMAHLSRARLHVLSLPLQHQPSHTLGHLAAQTLNLLARANLLKPTTTLVGWSMGGILGYEILLQLAMDQKPALVMLDSGFAQGLHPITFDPDFQLLMFAVELGLDPQHFAEFNRLPDSAHKLQWLQRHLRTLDITVEAELLQTWSEAYRARLQLLQYHDFARPVHAEVTLFKANWHSHGQPDLGWGECRDHILWQSVAADHQGIVKNIVVANWLQQHCV